jgi:hypothetical protein
MLHTHLLGEEEAEGVDLSFAAAGLARVCRRLAAVLRRLPPLVSSAAAIWPRACAPA